MATSATRFKLQAKLDKDFVIHTTSVTNNSGTVEVTRKWRQERVIGTGGFGDVWLQRAEDDGELRAVKVMRKHQTGGKIIDFSRELDTLAELREHRDLFVYFLGWFESTDSVFIATEYLECGDLGQYLKNFGRRQEPEAKEITKQLLSGLAVLHEKRICHRDIKPQNVLIVSYSPIWVKIADFGTSKWQANTELRTRLGTHVYCAPELMGFVRGTWRSYTDAIDLWALGSLVHEILTSKIPFLETYEYGDTFLSGVVPHPEPPRTDIKRLYEYCHLNKEFPTENLRYCGVSEEGIIFVKSLLVVDPRGRMPAKGALQSPWVWGSQSMRHLRTSKL